MSIVVTGAGGFVGRALLKALGDSGVGDVVAVDNRFATPIQDDNIRRVEGDLGDPGVLQEICRQEVEAVIHLAAVPGGAAEADPALSWRVNVQATADLIEAAARAGARPRFVFASTIAVYGDPLPDQGVDDQTPLRPRLIYGAHKAMIEVLVAAMSRRGAIDGLSIRLPGIVARPRGPSGLKSAFMSEVFHAFAAREPFVSPVSPDATLWLMSVAQCACNLVHALRVEEGRLPPSRALTLPALRATMEELVNSAAAAIDADPGLARFAPEADLEAAFGAHPPLFTPSAEAAGFRRDFDLDALTRAALEAIGARGNHSPRQ
jgi:nucleoside-diphosphate-sugar epimerase